MLLIPAGVTLGMIIGATPGVTSMMAIGILIPATFRLNPLTALVLLMAIYKGAVCGGSIPAILIRTPGTPAAAATAIDGYELAKKGQAGKALKMAVWSSFIGDTLSDFVLLIAAPMVAAVALRFGPVELTSILVFSLIIVGSVSGKSLAKGVIAALVGVYLGTVGLDPMYSVPRLSFRFLELFEGIPFVPMLIGLFAISELCRRLVQKNEPATDSNSAAKLLDKRSREGNTLTWEEMKRCAPTILRGTAIGTFLGALPGIGNSVAAFVSYGEARRNSKNPEEFGKGALEGVAAAESANNAVCGSNLIPALTLGIPGDATAAMILGAMMIHGLVPGPSLFKEQGDLVYGLCIGLILCNVAYLIIGHLMIKYTTRLFDVKNHTLVPIVLLLCVASAYSVRNNMFDVYLMLGFGLLGFVMERFGFPVPPLIIGFILGPMLEQNAIRSLLISRGSLAIFVTKPISLAFLLLTVFIVFQLYKRGKSPGGLMEGNQRS